MIESETTIRLRCDKCGGLFIDDYGHIFHFNDTNTGRKCLCDVASDFGWKCDETCLCPLCRKVLEK